MATEFPRVRRNSPVRAVPNHMLNERFTFLSDEWWFKDNRSTKKVLK
jgi:hypothetical protein